MAQEVVHEADTDEEASARIVRWAITGAIIGFFVVGGLFGLCTYIFSDGNVAGSITVALFTGMLGGPGFGGMMGWVVSYSKAHDEPFG
ncbi:MAG: hypothetical protein ACK5O2_10540 [Microthrixaceae bacterium]